MNIIQPLTRNFEAGEYLEMFWASAVVSILGVRFFLQITAFPQLGGGKFHIAHMLWGGLLMMIALVLLLSFLGKNVMRIASVVGGLGFGLFIDELGKFITRDNNYFFEPTIAIIYVAFVLLFFIFRSLEKYQRSTSKDHLMNALEVMKEVVIHDLDEEERNRALLYLRHCETDEPLAHALSDVLLSQKYVKPSAPSWFTLIKRQFYSHYTEIINKTWFTKSIVIFFILESMVSIIHVLIIVGGMSFLIVVTIAVVMFIEMVLAGIHVRHGVVKKILHIGLILGLVVVMVLFAAPGISLELKNLPSSVAERGELFSWIASVTFVTIGIYKMRRSRLRAYEYFKWSVLISILLTQVFVFYQQQLSAVVGLSFNILLLLALQLMIDQERSIPYGQYNG